MDQQLKKLIKELGDAISESLTESEQIADVISRIKAGGYDIFLVLEATIGFNKQDEKPSRRRPTITARTRVPEFKLNSQDMKFLKSLKISADDAVHVDTSDMALEAVADRLEAIVRERIRALQPGK